MRLGVRSWVQPIAVIVTMVLLYMAVGATRAAAAVYWGSEHDGLGAANLDGTEPQWDYFSWPLGGDSAGPVCGVAVNSEFLYWAGYRGIGRRRLEGEGVYPATVVSGLSVPCGVALDASHLYWANWGNFSLEKATGSLGRADLDGSEANTLVTGLEHPCGVAVSESHVYWVEEGGIGRANLDGSSPERPFIHLPDSNPSCGLMVSGSQLYWGQGRAIARANLEGGEIDRSFIPEAESAGWIAVQSGHIYWVSSAREDASIGRANLDGTDVDPAWISSTEGRFSGLAVDSRPTPPYLILPSPSIRFGQNVLYNLRSGAVLAGVYVPGQGQLTVTSRGLDWKVFGSTVPHATQGNFYLWWVRIRAGHGAVARRIRSQLRRRGWAPVKLRVEYTQERVYPVEATRTLILRRYRGASAGWVKHPRPPKKG
jgi:hypothetical protein